MRMSLSFDIGSRIRHFRERAGLTQKQLGEMVGKSESAIRNYELNNRTPDWESITVIANALKVSYYALDVSAADRTFRVVHMLFEMEDLYGLAPYIDRNGEVYLKFRPDIRAYREIMEKYDDYGKSEGEPEISPEDRDKIDEIAGYVLSPDSAVDLDNAIYAWAVASDARKKGLVDDNTYTSWKYKYPVFANIGYDGEPEIYEDNQAFIALTAKA